ncbi:MAG: hypothetical protein HC836_12625 [Richelia sp. RM2_1_2]|nr:hypothetical protein [Richelia sp. RM2_1_2]
MFINTGLTTRSFSYQTGIFESEYIIRFNDLDHTANIGFSGEKTSFFSFKSGKIFDEKSRLINTYSSNENIQVKTIFSANTYDYYFNNQIWVVGQNLESGSLSSFYIDTNSPLNLNSLFIKGEKPQYSINDRINYNNFPITGSIINNTPDLKFTIFSGEILNNRFVEISGFPIKDIQNTGNFYFISNFTGEILDIIVPVRFYTNFGIIENDFLITGGQQTPNYYITISPNNIPILTNGESADFGVFYSSESGALLEVSLEYVQGQTGNVFKQILFNTTTTGNITGEIVGSGFVLGSLTGIVSAFDNFLQTNVFATGSGLVNKFAYASGYNELNYSINTTGFASGFASTLIEGSGKDFLIFEGEIPVTGITRLESLSINDVSGSGFDPFLNTQITGELISGKGFKDLIFNGPIPTGIPYSNQVVIVDVSASDAICYNYTGIAAGNATGTFISGIFDFDFFETGLAPGQFSAYKYYSGIIRRFGRIEKFNPVTCEYETEISVTTSGIATGYFYLPSGESFPNLQPHIVNIRDCSEYNKLLIPIIVSGDVGIINNTVYLDGEVFNYESYFLIAPDTGISGENIISSFVETSDNVLSGNFTRTKTSRIGNTSSGSGFFKDIVNECGFESGEWKEIFSVDNSITTGHSNFAFNSFSHECGEVEFYLSGDGANKYLFEVDEENRYLRLTKRPTGSVDNIIFSRSSKKFSLPLESNFIYRLECLSGDPGNNCETLLGQNFCLNSEVVARSGTFYNAETDTCEVDELFIVDDCSLKQDTQIFVNCVNKTYRTGVLPYICKNISSISRVADCFPNETGFYFLNSGEPCPSKNVGKTGVFSGNFKNNYNITGDLNTSGIYGTGLIFNLIFNYKFISNDYTDSLKNLLQPQNPCEECSLFASGDANFTGLINKGYSEVFFMVY